MGFLDILDILVFALCLFGIYRLIRATVAFYIAIGLGLLYLVSQIFSWMSMHLMSTLTSQFSAVGLILLIIVFQPEIRKFLLLLGSNLLKGRFNILGKLLKFQMNDDEFSDSGVRKALLGAISAMSTRKTGVLIVFATEEQLVTFKETGIRIDGRVSQMLLETIFEKSSPLHDGAVLIVNNRIHSASCILPLSYDPSLPLKYGLRHRAAIGASEAAEVISIVVSEESGMISFVAKGKIEEVASVQALDKTLEKYGI